MKLPFHRLWVRLYVLADRNQRAAWSLALVVLSAWAYLTYNKEPYLSYGKQPFPVKAYSVHPGEVVPMLVTRCNNSSKTQIYSIARTLERVTDGRQFVMPDSIVQVEPGCQTIESRANAVPFDAPQGRYRLLGLSQIQTDFRIHYVSWSSEQFEVVP